MSGFRLCFLGTIGICPGNINSNNTLYLKQTSIINDYCMKQVSNVISNSSSAINQSQILSIKSGGNVTISNLDFSQYAALSSNSNIEISNNITNEDNLSELVNDLADVSIQQNLLDSGTPSGNVTRTELETKVITEITKKIKSAVTANTVSSCVSSIVSNQEITLITTGNVELNVINLSQTAMLVSECIMKTFVSAIKKMTLSTDIQSQITSNQERTDTNPITETIQGISESVSKTTSGIGLTIIIIIIIIIGTPIIIIIIIYLVRRKPVQK